MVIQRCVVNAGGRTRNFPVVRGRVEVYDMQAVFEEIDARNEGFALDTVAVEVIWVAIGGSD